MDEYFEKEKLCDWCLNTGPSYCDICVMNRHDLPAADVRPVVLCRDCKYAPIEDEYSSFPEWPFDEFYGNPCPYKCLDNWYSRKPAPDFFCAAGEKREES